MTSVKTRAVKRGQSSGTSTVTEARSSTSPPPSAAASSAQGSGASGAAGDRVDLAGDAVDAEAVDPVRRHLDLQHRLGQRQHLGQRRPRRRLVLEHEDAVGVLADLELGDGEDHPFRGDPAQLRLAQLLAARHPRPGQGDGDGLAGGDVGGAADDRRARRRRCRPCRPAAGRRRGAARRSAPCRRRSRRARAGRRRRSARPRSRSSPAARRAPPTSTPGSQYSRSHEYGHPHPNCSSIRTSLSKKRRRSGTPWRSIATRSTPRPKAKPCTRSGS